MQPFKSTPVLHTTTTITSRRSTTAKDNEAVALPKLNPLFGSGSLTPWLCALLFIWRASMLAFASEGYRKLLWQDYVALGLFAVRWFAAPAEKKVVVL